MTLVPELLQGAWKRRWIKYADGRFDESTIVIWLQFESRMVDVRLSPEIAGLSERESLSDCSREDLLVIADGDASSGTTTCSPLITEENGLRTATAEWASTIRMQPETRFPEPGILKWNADGSIMTERAPSGDYLEQWNRVRGTGPDAAAGSIRTLDNGGTLYSQGPLAVVVHDRRTDVPTKGRLVDAVREAENLDQARALVDLEFSVGQLDGNEFVVSASNHPWRIGEPLSV